VCRPRQCAIDTSNDLRHAVIMKYDNAMQKLIDAGWFPTDGQPSITAALDVLQDGREAAGRQLDDSPAIWYALAQELRRLADFHERNLIRHLKYERGLTWQQVADAVDSGLSSRQAAQARWSRLIEPGRGTPAGHARPRQ
jgi:hypothetical protein